MRATGLKTQILFVWICDSTHTHTHTYTHSLSLSLSHTHIQTAADTHTHTHTHTTHRGGEMVVLGGRLVIGVDRPKASSACIQASSARSKRHTLLAEVIDVDRPLALRLILQTK
jgi:hypothetical protein